MAEQEEQRKWMAANLTKAVYDSLMMIAANEGKHPTVIMEEMVAAAVIDYNNRKGAKAPMLVRVYAATQEMLHRKQIADMLRQLVQAELKDPDEDRWEQLQKLAGEAGVDLEKFISDVQKNELLAAMVINNGYVSPAQQLLLEVIPVNTVGVPANTIYDECRKRDVARDAIKNARIQLGVETYKPNRIWYWRWPKDFDPKIYVEQLNENLELAH